MVCHCRKTDSVASVERLPILTAPQVSDVRERRYEASGLGSLYLFRVVDEIVVDATKRVSVPPSAARRSVHCILRYS